MSSSNSGQSSSSRRRKSSSKSSSSQKEKPSQTTASNSTEQKSSRDRRRSTKQSSQKSTTKGTTKQSEAKTTQKPQTTPKKSTTTKKSSRGKSKKKTIQTRMVFAVEAEYNIGLITDKNRLVDFWIEHEDSAQHGISGNIYRGVVSNVLPGLNAAFADIGLEKHGFLSFHDLGPEIGKKGRQSKKELKVGDKVLVQMAKEAIADKGPALTGKISIPGRFLIYMPYTDVIRMSRMIDDKEREWLRELVEREVNREGGVIFRTASKGRSAREILDDLTWLTQTWENIENEFTSGSGPKLIHRELELFERMIRDEFTHDVEEIVIDHPRLKHRIAEFLKKVAPRVDPEVLITIHSDKKQSIWQKLDLKHDIDRLFSKNIHLDCGGRLIIEEMETLTAIDVNTGKNVAGKTADQTILETNLEAAREIPRQLRLRQIGGIIVVDFIDMRVKKDKDKVFQTLEAELERDRTPSDIQEFTDLGLIQITRQRSGKSLTYRLTYTCPHCQGSGKKPSINLG